MYVLRTHVKFQLDPTIWLGDTFNILKLDSWKFHSENPNFTYHIIYLNHLGHRLILWRFLFIIIIKNVFEFLTTFNSNSAIVHGNYTKIRRFSRKGSCIDLFDISFNFTHNITQFTKFPPLKYYFYLVKEFSWFIVN
jgi:hypothetical protein